MDGLCVVLEWSRLLEGWILDGWTLNGWTLDGWTLDGWTLYHGLLEGISMVVDPEDCAVWNAGTQTMLKHS